MARNPFNLSKLSKTFAGFPPEALERTLPDATAPPISQAQDCRKVVRQKTSSATSSAHQPKRVLEGDALASRRGLLAVANQAREGARVVVELGHHAPRCSLPQFQAPLHQTPTVGSEKDWPTSNSRTAAESQQPILAHDRPGTRDLVRQGHHLEEQLALVVFRGDKLFGHGGGTAVEGQVGPRRALQPRTHT